MAVTTRKFVYGQEQRSASVVVFLALLLSVGADYFVQVLLHQSFWHEWRTLLVLVAVALAVALLIQVFVFFLTSQSAQIGQLQQAVARAYLEALDNSLFNPCHAGRLRREGKTHE